MATLDVEKYDTVNHESTQMNSMELDAIQASLFEKRIKKWSERKDVTWQELAELFREAVDDKSLDIYQVCAFISTADVDDSFPLRRRISHYFKAFMCALIQTVGLVVFIYVQMVRLSQGEESKGFCAMTSKNEDVDEVYKLTQVLSVFLAIYISLKMGGLMVDTGDNGLYNIDLHAGKNCPPFVNKYWVLFGAWINTYALLFSVYGSYIVLYITEDILEVILNSVALFFLLDVDDYILDNLDYQRIEYWLQKKYDMKSYGDYKPPEPGCCAKTFIRLMSTVAYGAYGAGVLMSGIAPFWIMICY